MTIKNLPHVYNLIIIGRGTSAAVYLNTLRTYHQTTTEPVIPPIDILVIGKNDPWAGARGHEDQHYTKNINQAKQLFEHGRGKKGSLLQDPVDRIAWADQNHLIIEEISRGNVLDAEVTNVKKDKKKGYMVETIGQGPYGAEKVVIATGAGIETSSREYHHVPKEVSDFREKKPTQSAQILDLDQFQKGLQNSRTGKDKAVAIIGPNAGTDAVMEAATRGYARKDVYWLMSHRSKPGVALTWDVKSAGIDPTFTAKEAGKDRSKNGDQGCVVRYKDLEISVGRVKALAIKADNEIFEVDYLVYAVGQRGGGINRAVKDMGKITQVPFVDSALTGELEPIYDVNQRFTDMSGGGSGGAWQHVVGLQLEGSTKTQGIEIVGSAANQASRKVDHKYLDREYNALLKDLGSVYVSIANECGFVELGKMVTFSLIGVEVKKNNDAHYKTKVDRYLKVINRKLRAAATALWGPTELGKRDSVIKSVNDRVKDLCYMFMLRIKAARYLESKKVSAMLSEGLKRTLPNTVSDGRLLGGIQRNVAAVNQHHNVQHIRSGLGINFLEDQQTLALYVAVHYPNIVPHKANTIVSEIVTARKDKPRGFDMGEITKWDARLEKENRAPGKERWVTYFRPT